MSTTRTRTMNLRTPTFIKCTTNEPGGFNGDWPTNNNVGNHSTISDNNNGDFRKIRDQGGIILSDVSLSRWERTVSPGSIVGSNPGTGWSASQSGDLAGYITGNTLKSVSMTGLDGMNLLMEAIAKINKSPIVSGEIMADLGQTISMIKRPFKSATTLLGKMSSYRAKRLGKTATSAAKATSDAWLEYRYGWQPLVLDCKEVVKLVHKKRDRVDQLRLVARAGTSVSSNREAKWSATAGSTCDGSCTESKEARCSVGVIYDVVNRTSSEQLASDLGLDLRSMPSTVWELVPYSFVVDWFTNIGIWISAVTPNPGVNIRGWWVTNTYKYEFTRAGTYAYFGTPPNDKWTGTFGSETIKSSTYVRTCNQPLSFTPGLTDTVLSALHQADAAALLLKPILGQLHGFRH